MVTRYEVTPLGINRYVRSSVKGSTFGRDELVDQVVMTSFRDEFRHLGDPLPAFEDIVEDTQFLDDSITEVEVRRFLRNLFEHGFIDHASKDVNY